jgi:hypothetical protein
MFLGSLLLYGVKTDIFKTFAGEGMGSARGRVINFRNYKIKDFYVFPVTILKCENGAK